MRALHRWLLLALFIETASAWASLATPLGLHRARLPRPPLCAAGSVDVGILVEFSNKGGDVVLGAVQEPDGKKNWKVVTASGSTQSVAPRAIKLVVPGGTVPANQEVVMQHEAETWDGPIRSSKI